MHKIETILGGIAIILFGIASLLIYQSTSSDLFLTMGAACSVIGIIFSIIGVFYNGRNDSNDE